MPSVPLQTARSALRVATAEWHDRVDALFSQVDLGDRAAYGRFLAAQAHAHLATEDALTRAGADAVLPDWPDRQRAARLRADLAALQLPLPQVVGAISFDCAAAVLGGVYVLEGSRLGGRLLRRSVPADLPCSFLDAADPSGWRRLLELMEHRLADEASRERAIAASRAVFALFEESGRRHLQA